MRYCKNAQMITIAIFLLIAIAHGEDYMESGYIGSSYSSMGVDDGMSGLKEWLDAPVPTVPGYGSYTSTNNQSVSNPIHSSSKTYPQTDGTTVGSGSISIPAKFNITQETPSNVYLGAGHELPFSKYVSIMPFETNDLWIRGSMNWTRYFVVPVGTTLRLIANVYGGGVASFYKVIQTDKIISTSNNYPFYEGYNSMDLVADQPGRYMLYFVANNQPSNLAIVDVTGQAPPTQSQTYTGASQTQITSTTLQASAFVEDTPVKIQSQGMNGYQVYVDEVYAGTDGMGGDVLDGVFNFKVVGGQNHAIRVDGSQFNYAKNIYFAKGVLKIINVEPGTEVYI